MRQARLAGAAGVILLAGCGGDTPTNTPTRHAATMTVLGRGDYKPARTTAELAVRGTTAYTTTWDNSPATSVFYIWDVSANQPRLVDSVKVDSATTTSDVAVTDDGSLLVVSTETRPGGSIVIYTLADPRKPQRLVRYTSADIDPGVHTAEIGRVNGKLTGFLSVDRTSASNARLVIVDLSDAAHPRPLLSREIGTPYMHDSFIRDGILFLATWNEGLVIWDVGGGGKGGTLAAPVELGRIRTPGGEVHNVWWMKDAVTGSARYAFVGQEGPKVGFTGASGDIHVIDLGDMSAPKEVAIYSIPGAGTHNFWVDETAGILYAAYYNGGVRALDVRGDLGSCELPQKVRPVAQTSLLLCDMGLMGRELSVGLLDRGNPVFVWGVQYANGYLYASDMLNGLWKLAGTARP